MCPEVVKGAANETERFVILEESIVIPIDGEGPFGSLHLVHFLFIDAIVMRLSIVVITILILLVITVILGSISIIIIIIFVLIIIIIINVPRSVVIIVSGSVLIVFPGSVLIIVTFIVVFD